jgi:hypothetical protein
MSIAKQTITTLLLASAALFITGCDEEQSTAEAPAANVAPAQPSAPARPASPPPTSEPAIEPKHDCPEGSTGEGSFNKPCGAKGSARLMEVGWTGKMTDDGPSFRVTNKSKLVILYGKLFVYFYDKAGKQLELVDDSASPTKTNPYQTCGGKIFGGVMKVGEKAVLTFSCVKKEHVPEGTTRIEGEMQMVGFADESGEKVDFYWRNEDLVPKVRPKGGVK